MVTRSIALLLALASLTAACGSDDGGTSDTLPPPTTGSEAPTTDVPDTDVPITDSPIPITEPPYVADPMVQVDLDAARDLWSAQGPDSYTIVTQSLCFCPVEQWSDTIIDGVVTDHVALTDDVIYDPSARPMELLFDAVQQAIDDGYASLDVSYDPDTGAVEQFFIDFDTRMADEEYGVEIISLEPIG